MTIRNELVIDIETLGTGANACIASVAAVPFTIDGLKQVDPFYAVIDPQSHLNLGAMVTADTIAWWLRQPSLAIESTFPVDEKGKSTGACIIDVMEDLEAYIKRFKPHRVWANGQDFDLAILPQAMFLCGVEQPWDFWKSRDLRTLIEEHPQGRDIVKKAKEELGGPEALHNALNDAMWEADVIIKILQYRKETHDKASRPA